MEKQIKRRKNRKIREGMYLEDTKRDEANREFAHWASFWSVTIMG
ncbi:MAG: hypothetical protein PWP54_545 [Thermosipho sp. (in: thermotogales)]|nr:hypothetical protein [Thermosipho sp. (in: thermotogales)]